MIIHNISTIRHIFSIIGLPSPASAGLLNDIAQQHLLRKPNQEIWEVDHRFEDKREQLLPLFADLNFITEIPPVPGHYTYAIIHGSLRYDVQRLTEYLTKISQAGTVAYDSVVLLSSARPLDPSKEDVTLGSTESEMMQTLYERSQLAAYPYILVNAPLHPGGRPTTDDTVRAWLYPQKFQQSHSAPMPGKCLSISEQPFIQRQEKVLQMLLPRNFSVAAAGPASEENYPVAVYLDTLARTLYEELQFLASKP